jgi:ABC-type multidrug transport system ATPase subunit
MFQLSGDFTVGYGSTVIAQCDAPIEIQPSSHSANITVLSGSNGSGKTTLIRSLCQLIPTLQGTASWDHQPLSVLHQNKGIFYLPETLDFCAYLTSQQIIKSLSLNTAHALALAETFKLPLKPYFENLSKGQKQKIRLILSLERIDHPGLYLMDEPFSGLDIETRETAMAHLQKLFSDKDKRLIIALHTERFPDRWLQNSLIVKNGMIHLGGIGTDVYQLREISPAK